MVATNPKRPPPPPPPEAFANRPHKPKVCRLVDGRIGIFVGGAYQFTDDAGAASLRDQLDAVLAAAPSPSGQDHG